uniref:Uncharacterized protein n=1 Tax=Acrobeloides nanus TaxID=290746 RepID=A0A914CHF6_9BILA
MQGIYNGAGIGLQILGPIFLSKIYTMSGPKYIWIFMLVLTNADVDVTDADITDVNATGCDVTDDYVAII